MPDKHDLGHFQKVCSTSILRASPLCLTSQIALGPTIGRRNSSSPNELLTHYFVWKLLNGIFLGINKLGQVSANINTFPYMTMMTYAK